MKLEPIDGYIQLTHLSRRLREGGRLAPSEREWLANYLADQALEYMRQVRGPTKGRPKQHATRDRWLTMDYLVNDHSEKELQARWNVKTRTHKIVAKWRKVCTEELKRYSSEMDLLRLEIEEWRTHVRRLAQK